MVKLRPQPLRKVETLPLDKLGEKGEVYYSRGSSLSWGDSKNIKGERATYDGQNTLKQPSLWCVEQANQVGEAIDSLHATQET